MSPVTLYDLKANASQDGGPLFSPTTMKARLALVHKGVDFNVKEVTFRDIRTKLSGELGKKATVPILELEDGTRIVDSVEIIKYLEKTFPLQRSIFLPESNASSVDISSEQYQCAVEESLDFNSKWGASSPPGHFGLASSVISGILDKMPSEDSDHDYFVSDAKLGGKDTWRKLRSFDDEFYKSKVKEWHDQIEVTLSEPGRKFLQSPSQPGMKDIGVFGRVHHLYSVRHQVAEALMGEQMTQWWKRMIEHYGVQEAVGRRLD